jgi:hypothetical protein
MAVPLPSSILDPLFTQDVIDRVMTLQPDPATLGRVEVLRGRANEGTLSDAERDDYSRIVDDLDLLATLKLGAMRRGLLRPDPARQM